MFATPYTLISWSIYRWPVAFLTHREDYSMAAFEMGSRKAKFTLELDEDKAYYGFYVEKNAGPMDYIWDWPRLMDALQHKPDLRAAIDRAESQYGARFLARRYRGDDHFHFTNGLEMGAKPLWDESRPAGVSADKRLSLRETIPDDAWWEIYILGSMPKHAAIRAGLSVANEMGELMRTLLPIYRAAVTGV